MKIRFDQGDERTRKSMKIRVVKYMKGPVSHGKSEQVKEMRGPESQGKGRKQTNSVDTCPMQWIQLPGRKRKKSGSDLVLQKASRRGSGLGSGRSEQSSRLALSSSWYIVKHYVTLQYIYPQISTRYLSPRFILVEIICASQSEAKLLSFPLKSCKFCLSGKSIN